MKPNLFAVIIILVAGSCLYAQTGGTWARFSPTAGRFKVMMPAVPEDTTKPYASGPQPYTFRAYSTNAVYVVGWVDESPSREFVVRKELNDARDGYLKGDLTKLSERDIWVNGNPGIEFTTQDDKQFMAVRVYAVGRRLYLLAVSVRKGTVEDIGRKTFFDSFEPLAK